MSGEYSKAPVRSEQTGEANESNDSSESSDGSLVCKEPSQSSGEAKKSSDAGESRAPEGKEGEGGKGEAAGKERGGEKGERAEKEGGSEKKEGGEKEGGEKEGGEKEGGEEGEGEGGEGKGKPKGAVYQHVVAPALTGLMDFAYEQLKELAPPTEGELTMKSYFKKLTTPEEGTSAWMYYTKELKSAAGIAAAVAFDRSALLGNLIDHLLATRTVAERTVWAEIDREARKGKPIPSDHAPLVIDLDQPGHPFDAGWTSAQGRIAARLAGAR